MFRAHKQQIVVIKKDQPINKNLLSPLRKHRNDMEHKDPRLSSNTERRARKMLEPRAAEDGQAYEPTTIVKQIPE